MLLSRVRAAAWRSTVSRAVRRTPTNPFPNFLTRFEDRITPTFGVTGSLSPASATSAPIAAVSSGPRLLSVDTAQSAVLNATLSNLVGPGTNLNVSAVDYNALSNADVNLGALLGSLQTQLGVATPADALTTNATLSQIFTAAAAASPAGATANALTAAATATAGATGGVKLGDLFQATVPNNNFAGVEINALDLLTGGVQLFNYQNAVSTTAPITVSGASLGLGSVLNSVAVQARVVEPPVVVVGPAGTQFHSAAVRLKLDVDLVDTGLDTSALLGPIAALIPGTTVAATATVGQIQLFADVARGSGSIQSISAITNAVTLQATPSVADVYLGTVSDAAFFNRTRPINVATDLTGGVIGSVQITATTPLNIQLLNLNLGLTAESAALGLSATPQFPVFNPPFPAYQTIGSSSAVVGNLVTSLLTNLDVRTTGNLGLLSPLVGTLATGLTTAAGTVLQPVLTNLLTNLADPALDALGVGLGEMDLAVLGGDGPDAVTAVNDVAVTLLGQPVTANVLANDINPNNLALTAAVSTAAGHGTAAFNADNTVTYTPAAGYLGIDTFAYTVTDPFSRTATATVTVTVTPGVPPVNLPPILLPDVATTTANVPVAVNVLANDSDPDGGTLTVTGVSAVVGGTAVVNANGSVTFTPTPGFVGAGSFTYTASDGQGGSGSAAVVVTVGSRLNTPPVLLPDVATTTAGTAVTVPVLANDIDLEGDTLTVTGISAVVGGTAVINANGTVTFTPTAGFIGAGAFVYTADDGFGGSGTAAVAVTVTPPINLPPVILPDLASTTAGVPVTVNVLANDLDLDGGTLTVTGVSAVVGGTAVVNGNGTVTFTPDAGFVGAGAFIYTAADGQGGSGAAAVAVTVGARLNTPPVLLPDVASTTAGVPVTVDVLANDLDLDGDSLTVTGISAVVGGTAVVNANGTVTFTPNAGFIGAGAFVYTAADGFGGSGTAAVAVTVTPPINLPPVILPDVASTTAGVPVTVNVLANDLDLDGGTLTVTGVSAVVGGTAVVNADGTVTFTPDAGFVGAGAFIYTASDGQGGSGAAAVAVTVLPAVPPVNLPPVILPDVASTTAGVPVTIDVLANDSDPDGGTITVTGVSAVVGGTAVVNANGTVTFTPAAGFVGAGAFVYTAADGQGGSGTAAVAVTVGARLNTPPVLLPDIASTTAGVATTVNVLANDTDLDGDTLTVTGVSAVVGGTAVVNANGTVTFTPATGFVGAGGFVYTAADGFGGTGVAAVAVTVGPRLNTPPVAVDDVISTTTGTTVGVSVLANDIDLDGDALTITGVTQPAHGTATVFGNGTVLYTPAAGYVGVDSFTYTAADGFGGSGTATVVVTVGPGANLPPVVLADAATTAFGTAVTVAVLANDSDPDGGTLTVTGVSAVVGGTALVNANGTVTFTPTPGFVGAGSFVYTAADGQGGTGSAGVVVTVLPAVPPPNTPPAILPDIASTTAGVAVTVNVLANDTDADGNTISVTGVSAVVGGTAVVNANGTVTFTPDAGFVGAGSFVYAATDGQGGTGSATVSVAVNAPGNLAPVITPDVAATAFGTAVTVNVLANDFDLDGGTITVTGVSSVVGGSAVVNANGTVTFTPATGFVGAGSFIYTATDGQGGTGSAGVAVAVAPLGNTPPAIAADAATTTAGVAVGINVLANDTDADGNPITVTGVTAAAGGSVVVNANGTITFTPGAGFVGTTSFTYTAADGAGGTGSATVTVTVNAAATVNSPPAINADSVTTTGAVAIDVLANDTDADGDLLSVSGVTTPAHGTVTINANGTISYTPVVGYVGADSFTYTAVDGRGGSGTATVTVAVGAGGGATNTAPAIAADAADTLNGTATVIAVLANDIDADGDPLTITGVTAPMHGTVAVNADGTLTYTPAAGYVGSDVFFYTAGDGRGGSGTAAVTVRVAGPTIPPAAPPVANVDPDIRPDVIVTAVGTTVNVPVLANDTDANGDPLTIAGVTPPTSGTVVVNADGTISYTPAPGFDGVDVFTYVATDGRGGVGTSTVTVTVGTGLGIPVPVPVPPVVVVNADPDARPDVIATAVGAAVNVPVLANDVDANGDPLTIGAVTQPAHGTVVINADGTVTYTPAAGFDGIDAFSYTATDGHGGVGTGTVTATVGTGRGTGDGGVGVTPPINTLPNTAPVINGDTAVGAAGDAIKVSVLVNDNDADGDPLTITGVSQPLHGSVVVNADGTVTYTPAAGFLGLDTFTYTATDGRGGVGTARVQVVSGRAGPGPVVAEVKQYVVGADTLGGPRVTVFNPDGTVRFDFFAYDPDTRFGVNPVMGDIDGDGVSDIVTSPGFGGGPHIRVLSGIDLHPIVEFFAFDPSFRGGANIAVGDVTGDGVNDIVVTAGKGGGPRVIVIDGTKLDLIQPGGVIAGEAIVASFYAFDPSFGGGVSVAVTDRDNNGIGEVVTGAGPGGTPLVRTWDIQTMTQISEFMAFDASVSAGVNIGGRGDYLVVGAGAGAAPDVRVYRGPNQDLVSEGSAYETSFRGGVRVNFVETIDPTKELFVVGAGVGGGPRIKVLRPNLEEVVPDYFAFESSFRGGVFVS